MQDSCDPVRVLLIEVLNQRYLRVANFRAVPSAELHVKKDASSTIPAAVLIGQLVPLRTPLFCRFSSLAGKSIIIPTETLMPILVVDDNDAHRYALTRMLYHAGFAVLDADRASTASELARSEHPSLILMDINLPDGNGYEVFNQLRSDPRTSDIPVVFHSATHPTHAARFRVDSLGAEGFLTYPISESQLIAVVNGVTARRPPKLHG